MLFWALFAALAPQAARAAWMPTGIVAVTDAHPDVRAAIARASSADDALRRRREHWTYRVESHRIGVDIAVRDDDFRSSLSLDGLTNLAGRSSGASWRADGNGVAHGVEADLQGDAADRAPQALFPIDAASCTLAGRTRGPQPSRVVELQRDGDKIAFLYIAADSGAIYRIRRRIAGHALAR